MRPVPIPSNKIPDGHARRTIVGPDGDPTGEIRPVDALIAMGEYGPVFRMLIRVEPDEIEKLRSNPHFWLSLWADHLHPFAVELDEP